MGTHLTEAALGQRRPSLASCFLGELIHRPTGRWSFPKRGLPPSFRSPDSMAPVSGPGSTRGPWLLLPWMVPDPAAPVQPLPRPQLPALGGGQEKAEETGRKSGEGASCEGTRPGGGDLGRAGPAPLLDSGITSQPVGPFQDPGGQVSSPSSLSRERVPRRL